MKSAASGALGCGGNENELSTGIHLSLLHNYGCVSSAAPHSCPHAFPSQWTVSLNYKQKQALSSFLPSCFLSGIIVTAMRNITNTNIPRSEITSNDTKDSHAALWKYQCIHSVLIMLIPTLLVACVYLPIYCSSIGYTIEVKLMHLKKNSLTFLKEFF